MAENIGWWHDAWVGNLFQEAPWKDPPFISYTAELHRDASQRPTNLINSWAPAGLIPVKMLIANDADSVLHALAELKHCEVAAARLKFFRSDEVSVHRSFSEDLPDLLEVDRYAPLLLVRRIYYDQDHHPVLAQELWSPADEEIPAGRCVLPSPDAFEIAACAIRELPYRSKSDISDDAFIPWSHDATAHKEVTP